MSKVNIVFGKKIHGQEMLHSASMVMPADLDLADATVKQITTPSDVQAIVITPEIDVRFGTDGASVETPAADNGGVITAGSTWILSCKKDQIFRFIKKS